MTRIRLHPALSAALLGLVLGGLSVLFVDRPLAEFLKHHVAGGLEHFFKIATNLGRAEYYMVPAALIWIGAKIRTWPELQNKAAYLFLTTAGGGIALLLIKFCVGRTRPKLWLDQGIFTLNPFSHGWGVNSFPSGHTQAAWAAMTALAVLFPKYRWLFFAVATLVAVSRVVLTEHWLSDAIGGMVLGFAAAMTLRKMLKP